MDIAGLLNLSYGGRVLPPRFVDTDEDFDFLTTLLYEGYDVKRETQLVYGGYTSVTTPSKNRELLDKIAIALVGNYRVSEQEWAVLEDYLDAALANRDVFVKVLGVAAHCVNGHHTRFARSVVTEGLDVSDRRIVDAVWRAFSMLYHWVFMTYAYYEYQRG